MAGTIASLGGSFKPAGKVMTFLGRIFAPFRFKKKTKTKTGKRPKQGGTTSSVQTETVKPATLWPPQRLNIMDKLWGEGRTSPNAAEFLRVTLPLLGLSEKKSLLLLGAGLGGVGRTMVDETGVWVTGLEADAELAELGKNQTKMAGMQKRAPVTLADFEQPKLKENSFNTVISLESLYRVEAKEQLYTAMVAALRVEGELLMTDFVKVGDEAPQPLEAWINNEPVPPHLWKPEQIQGFLKTQNLEMRPPEDVTAKYRAGVFKGFFRYLSNVTKPELLEVSGDLIAECAYWAGQLAAIDSGALKVFKFHAFKLPEKRKAKF